MTEQEAWLWLAKLWREGGGTICGRVGICVVISEMREQGDIDGGTQSLMMAKIAKHAPPGVDQDLRWPIYDWKSRAEFCERMAETP